MDDRQARLIQQKLMDIVHDYDVLDNRMVYFTAKRLMEDARKYVGSVYSYLSEMKG